MNILIIGANGFTGRRMLDDLVCVWKIQHDRQLTARRHSTGRRLSVYSCGYTPCGRSAGSF